MYKSGEEYNIKYYNKEGKEQTCTITPEEDMNRPQMIKKLKEENKDFLKLIECKLMEGDLEMEYKTYKDLVEDGRAADVCDNVYDMCVYIDYATDSDDYYDQCLEQICSDLQILDADIDYSIVTCNITDWVKKHLKELDEVFEIDAPDEDSKVEEFVNEMFNPLVSGGATEKAYEQLYNALIGASMPSTEQPDNIVEEAKIEEAKKNISELVPTLKERAYELLQSEEMGFTEDEAKDYTVIELKPFDDAIKVEVRAELTYDGMMELIDCLNPIVQSYDKESYFDMEDSGIAVAIIEGYSLPVVEEAKIEDPMEELTESLVEEIVEEAEMPNENMEEVKATISKERKAEIIAELFDWIDYHDLDAYEFLNVTEEDLDKCSHLELDEEKMDDIISKGIVCVDEHIHDMDDKIIAFKDIIGLSNEEIEILEVDLDLSEEQPLEESNTSIDLSMEIKPWYNEEHKEDGDFWKDIKDGVTFQDVQDALDKGEDVYEVFGVGDSVVRENIFQKLAELRNVDYDVIYNEWLHSGEQISEDELNALKQVFSNIVNKKTESVLVEDEEIIPETEEPIEVNPDEGSEELEAFENEDMTEVQKNAEEAISQVKDPTEEEKLAVNVINGTMDVLIADENSAINGYREFLNQAKETLLPPLYNVLEKEMQEIINDEEDHIAKLETLKAAFHLEDIPLDETKEVKAEAVTLNAVLDELEAGIDSPMAQEDGPKIEEYIKNHPEATLEEVVNAYKNYEETGLFECKEIKTEDHQLYYDDIQEMSTEERHKLWMSEHEEDFEDTDEGNNKFWDWAEEEFPMKELNESNK